MQTYPKMDPSTSQNNAQHSVISSPSKSSSNSMYQYNLSQDSVPHRYVPSYNMGMIGGQQYRSSPYDRVPLPNEYNRSSNNSNSIIISGSNSAISTNVGDKTKFYPKINKSSDIIHPKQQKSVLMPHQNENVSRQSPPDPGGDQSEHVYKKMRLSEPKPSTQNVSNVSSHDPNFVKNHESSAPFVPTYKYLNVDIKDVKVSNETYNPQVEAISPTMPSDVTDSRTVKDDLIMQINKVDIDIALAEKSRSNIFGKIQILTESCNKPQIINKLSVEYRAQQNLVHKIYEENRKKAAFQHSLINSICQSSNLPIYNQPSDLSVCEKISSQYHATFKCRLVVYLKKIKMEKSKRNLAISEEYRKLTNDWNKKVEKIESNAKRKSRELKNREFFEKVFVELRKQREEKERFNRVGSRVKSEADLEEIMDGLQEQALEDKKMRSYAVIPPLMLDKTQKRFLYHNENGIILDMVKEYQNKQKLNLWTSGEKEIFKEKYLQHPKNFGLIASCLDRKSVQDCIRHYYLNKKFENFKQLLRKSRSSRTRSSRNPQKTQQSQTQCIIDSLTTGVTTRLQREQQQKMTVKITNFSVSLASSEQAATATTTTTSTTTCNKTNNITETSSKLPADQPQQPQPKNEPEATKTTSNESKTQTETQNAIEVVTSQSTEVKSNSTVIEESSSVVATKKEVIVNSAESSTTENDSELAKKEISSNLPLFLEDTYNVTVSQCQTSETENQSCFICKSQNCVRTRSLKKSKCHWYGISEDTWIEGSRVCNSCESKSVRNRFKNCPIPFCINFKENYTRKLYNFTPKLSHLSEEEKANVFKEMKIPTTVTKCCTKCYISILNKLKIDDYEIKKESIESDYSNSTCDDEDDFETDKNSENKSIVTTQHSVINVSKVGSDDKKLQPPIVQPRKKQKPIEEYDSSATETADEESEISPINRQSPKINKTSAPNQSLNVRDFLYNFIERTLKNTPSQKNMNVNRSNSGNQPSLNAGSYNPIIRDNYNQSTESNEDMFTNAPSRNNHDRVVSQSSSNCKDINVDLNNGYNRVLLKTPHSDMKYVQTPPKSNEVSESETLDLSLRKISREVNHPVARTSPSAIKNCNTVGGVQSSQYRNAPPQQHMYLPYPHPDSHNMSQMTSSISLISSVNARQSQQQRNVVSPLQPNHNKQQQQQQQQQTLQKSPKQQTQQQQSISSPNFGKGSITHGTPGTHGAPFSLLSQPSYMQTSYSKQENNKTGSITQGTPLIQATSSQFEMGKGIGRIHSASPQSSNQSSNKYSKQSYVNHQYPYNPLQCKPTKEILMNDYITSQQMQQKLNKKGDIEDTQKPQSNIHYYEKDKQQQQSSEHANRHVSPPQRQGVIQRHTKPSSPSYGSELQHSYALSGHDAFTSLVEVAAQQPQLPVPSKETIIHDQNEMKFMGLMRDNNFMNSKFRSAINNEIVPNDLSRHVLDHRSDKDDPRKMFSNHSSYSNNPKNPSQCDKDTRMKAGTEGLSAKNLIDAIITQSINKGGSNDPPMSKYYSMRDHPTNSSTDNANSSKESQPNVINSSYDRDQKSSGSSEMVYKNEPPVFKSITIGELTNTIITKDFEANSAGSRQLIGTYPGDWKPQQQAQQRRPQPIKMYESANDKTGDNVHLSNPNIKYNCDISSVNYYNQPQQSPMNGLNISGVKPMDRNSIQMPQVMPTNNRAQQFTLERYVKNKIVEAMRTEDDRHEDGQYESEKSSSQEAVAAAAAEKRKESLIKRHEDFQQQQQYNKPINSNPFPGQYYPYNALNVQSQSTSDILPTSTSSIPPSSIEPKPLLSAQYEALSDED